MKRQRKSSEPPVEEFPVWTFEQAGRAVPYIFSIMNSIRECYLEAQSQRHQARKLENKPGRPDRHTIIRYETAKREADRLQGEVAAAAQELADLNIQCVDPINGVAMIPFVQGEQLAWLIFNLFEPAKIAAWRFHHDPLTARRPLDEIEVGPLPAMISM
jgi:uncharacterized protein DUF2203